MSRVLAFVAGVSAGGIGYLAIRHNIWARAVDVSRESRGKSRGGTSLLGPRMSRVLAFAAGDVRDAQGDIPGSKLVPLVSQNAAGSSFIPHVSSSILGCSGSPAAASPARHYGFCVCRSPRCCGILERRCHVFTQLCSGSDSGQPDTARLRASEAGRRNCRQSSWPKIISKSWLEGVRTMAIIDRVGASGSSSSVLNRYLLRARIDCMISAARSPPGE